MILTLRTCDVCGGTIARRTAEVRIVVCVTGPDGRSAESHGRTDTCSPACALTAAQAAIERAWAPRPERKIA